MNEDKLSRFIEPIYQHIDARKYKHALSLCESKKIEKEPIVQMLKAHCLERLGRNDEALVLCRNLIKKQPVDERVISVMQVVMRLCGKIEEMIPVYEHACAQFPHNDEMLEQLFYTYVRKFNFAKQQSTAMRLYKMTNRSKYMYWAGLSILLQGQPNTKISKQMLSLGEKMMVKVMELQLSKPKQAGVNAEALELLIEILLKQDKLVEALEMFDHFMASAPSGSRESNFKPRSLEGERVYEEDIETGPMSPEDQLLMEAELAERNLNWERARTAYDKLVTKFNSDDWNYLKGYIRCSFQFAASSSSASATFVADIRDEVKARIHQLQCAEKKKEENGQRGVKRGPFLAELEMLKQYLQLVSEVTAVKSGFAKEIVGLIKAYSERFGVKTCCFTDLKQYLELFCLPLSSDIPADSRDELVAYFASMSSSNELISIDCENEKAAYKQQKHRLLSLKAMRFLGCHDPAVLQIDDLRSLIDGLMKEYQVTLDARKHKDNTNGQREIHDGDDFLLMACHLMLDLYNREVAIAAGGRKQILLEIAILLEYGLQMSKFNFQMKLLLAQIYCALGASGAGMARYKELDVKQILLDSLTYLIFDPMLNLGNFPEVEAICQRVVRMHLHSEGDVVESLPRAYKLRSLAKAKDVTEFHTNRMEKSQQLFLCRSELENLQLLNHSHSLKELQLHLQQRIKESKFLQTPEDDIEHISANQDRNIQTKWTQSGKISTCCSNEVTSSMWLDADPLFRCVDRSVDREMSKKRLRLGRLVPKMILSSLEKTSASDYEAQHQAFVALLQELMFVPKDDQKVENLSLIQSVWQISKFSSTFMLQLLNSPDEGSDEHFRESPNANLQAIRQLLARICDQVSRSMSSAELLDVPTVGLLSEFFAQGGHWGFTLLAIASKHLTKLKKKKAKAVSPIAVEIRETLHSFFSLYESLQSKFSVYLEEKVLGTDSLVAVTSPSGWCLNTSTQDQLNFADLKSQVVKNLQASYAATGQCFQSAVKIKSDLYKSCK